MQIRVRIRSEKVVFLLAVLFSIADLKAGGISVDAGITPPQDRFILRSQYRYMSMENALMTRYTHMAPLVLAYGVTPGITVMARGMYIHQTVSNSPEIRNGMNDLFVLSKFRLYRKNAEKYVFGIAPHIASNIPVGSSEISNRTWNPELGLNISFRPRFLALDVSAAYVFSDITGRLDEKPGNIFSINTALSAVVPLKTEHSSAISPVIEWTYQQRAENKNLPKADILFISPGASFIFSNLTLEVLLQIPVYQSDNSGMMNQNSRFILGVKYMF